MANSINAPTTKSKEYNRYNPNEFNSDPDGLSDYEIKADFLKYYNEVFASYRSLHMNKIPIFFWVANNVY